MCGRSGGGDGVEGDGVALGLQLPEAAADILVLAGKGKAFRPLDKLLVRQGGHQVLPCSALALAATIGAWAQLTDTPPAKLIPTLVR